LFDEVEKASDALWNLLLGILDKATLTLGDNRRVDFTRAMIFMTSNLGAREMNSLIRPGLGFAGPAGANTNAKLADKLLRAGQEAARRKFTPEFMNRIDKIVVFQPLGEAELRSILSLELDLVQDRVSRAVGGGPVALTLAPEVQDFLLREGTDPRYGARPLKRAVDRLLVHPMSNLIASGQVQGRDRIFVDLEPEQKRLVFFREFEEIAAEMETSAAA
jgi:ATP-dependent Clp protease ATP-binding subunit ClpA